jgi:hypothetical protein
MSVRTAIATVTIAALALASGTAAAPPAPGPGQITAGTGCSVHCIVKALVTPTASYANVAIETSVPTKVWVIASRARSGGPMHRSTQELPDAALGVPSRTEARYDVPDRRHGN